MRGKAKKRKNIKSELRLKLIVLISIIVIVIILSVFRSYLFSLCKNIQHEDDCCHLAYNSKINSIGETMIYTHRKINIGVVI